MRAMTESEQIRILCMEDDLGLARLVQKRLERAGYTVDLAHDGGEGLAMYATGSYDVVAVDQAMPVHDGLEVIRTLASQGTLPPTIMITGGGSEQIAVEAMKLGARDYIVKDVEGGYLDLLPTVIEQVLQRQRLAVVPVGRVAHEPGAREGGLADDQHFSSATGRASSSRRKSRSRGPYCGSASANSVNASK